MSYFSEDVPAAGRLHVARAGELRPFEVSEGIEISPVLGERLNVSVVVLEPDAVAPVHTHSEEQIGYVIRGSCEFTDGASTWTLEPGDVYHAAGGVPHGARALAQGCVILDAFSPPRAGIRELLEG